MTQEQNTCDCTHTQACKVCAASKDIDWNIIEPKEQNTATGADGNRWTVSMDDKLFTVHKSDKPPFFELRNAEDAKALCGLLNHHDELDYKLGCLLDHATGSTMSYTHYTFEEMRDCVTKHVMSVAETHAEEHHTEKLKELSEKGEPTEEEIREICWTDDMKAVVDCDPRAIASGAMIQLRDRLSPVIAALRAENKKKDEEIASLLAQLEESNLFEEWILKTPSVMRGSYTSGEYKWWCDERKKSYSNEELKERFRTESKGGKAHE